MPTYLDYNATTPVDKRVVEAMLPYLREHFGNPSSAHRFGRIAQAALEDAREQVAELVKAHPSQVIFTSGGTEANNLAVKGVTARNTPGHIAIGATEHPSVVTAAASLREDGWRVITLAVDGRGRVEMQALSEALKQAPALVSVMIANNETGVIQNVSAISELVRARSVVMHTDAVQAAGKVPLDFAATGAHLMSLSAHKIYGPKGVGALIVDKAVDLRPQLHGGGHEKDRRAGTENVAGIVGFGAAAELVRERLAEYGLRLSELRKRLESGLRAIGDIEIFSGGVARLPNTVCFGVSGMDGETLLLNLDKAGMAVSSGSACSSGSTEPSPVLLAMGISPDVARGALRVSLGWDSTASEVDAFVNVLGMEIANIRSKFQSAASA